MKVKDIISRLENLDPELPVILAKDDEGNGYYKMNYNPTPAYCPDLEENWIDEVHYQENLEEYKEINKLEKTPAINCVVF